MPSMRMHVSAAPDWRLFSPWSPEPHLSSPLVAAAHHRNWSHRGGLGNNLVMFGLSMRR